MKSLFVLFVAIVVALGFSTVGWAQSTAGGGKVTFTGTVVAVNPADKVIVVKGTEGEKTFNVSDVPETFQSGQTVHVTYRVERGTTVVLSVRSGMNTAMAGPAYGYDPYYGYEPHVYGYDPYLPTHPSRAGA